MKAKPRSQEYIDAAVRVAEARAMLDWQIMFGGLVDNSVSKEHTLANMHFRKFWTERNSPIKKGGQDET